MELTSEENASLNGERGETLQTAYRILVTTGEATNAEKLIPITWAHLSGVNYNTIGDAFLHNAVGIENAAKVLSHASLVINIKHYPEVTCTHQSILGKIFSFFYLDDFNKKNVSRFNVPEYSQKRFSHHF